MHFPFHTSESIKYFIINVLQHITKSIQRDHEDLLEKHISIIVYMKEYMFNKRDPEKKKKITEWYIQ